jgi:hypothetical protein
MFERTILVLLGALAPIGLRFSFPILLGAYASTAALILLALQYLWVSPAPAHRAERFRSLLIAHRGGQPSLAAVAPILAGTQAGATVAAAGLTSSPSSMGNFPENSLAAFRWACSSAASRAPNAVDGFELDACIIPPPPRLVGIETNPGPPRSRSDEDVYVPRASSDHTESASESEAKSEEEHIESLSEESNGYRRTACRW